MTSEPEGRAKRRRPKPPGNTGPPALEAKPTPEAPPTETAGARPRRALALGSTLLPAGLALVGIGPSDIGTGVTLAGLIVLIYGVHSFGRLGPA